MDEGRKKTILLGKNVEEIPCFRSSFMTGAMGGTGLGLAHFLATSRVKRSADVGVYSFVAITFGYWCYCRYKFSLAKFEYQKLQHSVQEKMVYEGTSKDSKLDDA